MAYLEKNVLINRITGYLTDTLAEDGVRSAATPAMHNCDQVRLICRWSHKGVDVITGHGCFGLHRKVITDAGCAGRFGSLVVDCELEINPVATKECCLCFFDGCCHKYVSRYPVNALYMDCTLDKQNCNRSLLGLAKLFGSVSAANACGKCTIGPCSLASSVQNRKDVTSICPK